jgi:hypothetical protein
MHFVDIVLLFVVVGFVASEVAYYRPLFVRAVMAPVHIGVMLSALLFSVLAQMVFFAALLVGAVCWVFVRDVVTSWMTKAYWRVAAYQALCGVWFFDALSALIGRKARIAICDADLFRLGHLVASSALESIAAGDALHDELIGADTFAEIVAYSQPTNASHRYEEWLVAVDHVITGIYELRALPDAPYRQWYDAGLPAGKAAEAAYNLCGVFAAQEAPRLEGGELN